MTNSLPTLRPGYSFHVDIDSKTRMLFLSIYRDNGSEPIHRLVSHALPFMPESYEYAIAMTAARIEGLHPRLFTDSPATERSRYQYALNNLLKDTDQ